MEFKSIFGYRNASVGCTLKRYMYVMISRIARQVCIEACACPSSSKKALRVHRMSILFSIWDRIRSVTLPSTSRFLSLHITKSFLMVFLLYPIAELNRLRINWANYHWAINWKEAIGEMYWFPMGLMSRNAHETFKTETRMAICVSAKLWTLVHAATGRTYRHA